MKKLMIAAAIVCAAAFAQAASVSWKASAVKGADGADVSGSTVATFTVSIYDAATDALVGSSSDSSASFKAYSANIEGTANNKAYYAILTAEGTFGGKDYVLADSIANTKFYFTTDDAATYNINLTVGDGITTPAGGIGTWSASSWQAVPEPTSGLLLLLGVAGLALRRRRA